MLWPSDSNEEFASNLLRSVLYLNYITRYLEMNVEHVQLVWKGALRAEDVQVGNEKHQHFYGEIPAKTITMQTPRLFLNTQCAEKSKSWE